jgi:hypothetical protein
VLAALADRRVDVHRLRPTPDNRFSSSPDNS